MKSEILGISEQLVGAACNGIWQGVLITLLVAIVLKALSPTNAATRHAVWFVTLIVCALLIPAQFISHLSTNLPELAQRDVAPQITGEPQASQLTTETTHVERPDSISTSDGSLALDEVAAETPPVFQQPEAENASSPGDLGQVPESAKSDLVLTEAPDSANAELAGTEPRTIFWKMPPMRDWLRRPQWNIPLSRSVSLALVILASIVATVRLTRLCFRLWSLAQLKASSVSAPPDISELFEALKAKAGIKRRLTLRLSTHNHAPALLGFVRPMVILPQAFGGTREIEPILRHELAHARRYDDWANLAQNAIQAVVFFHPAVWWIARRLALEREIACDDHVLQGGTPRSYALLLASLANRFQGNRALPAPGAATSRSQLHQRIDMILNTKRNASPSLSKTRLGIVTTAAAALAALGIYCAPRIVLAQDSAGSANSASIDVAASTAQDASVEANTGADVFTYRIADSEDSEAKPKPEPQPTATVRTGRAVVSVSAPAANIVVPTPPVPPEPIAGSGGYHAAVVEHPVKIAPAEGDSLEARLARVERMLDELLAQRKGGQPRDFAWSFNRMEKNKEAMNAFQKRVEQQAKIAAEHAAKMEKFKMNADGLKAEKDTLAKQIEELHRSREMLEKQMEKLDQSIEKLEEQQERIDERQAEAHQDAPETD